MATTAEYGLGKYTFPRGWFMVADAATLSDGAVQSLRFFGHDLILYRGKASGKPILAAAYCPHRGAHLGGPDNSCLNQNGSRIEGDAIRCPFHGWRFRPDGRCDDIPYAAGAAIPPAARIEVWLTQESVGAIFAWHDPEGAAPDVALPALPEWDDPAWIRWLFDDLGVLKCHPVELVDNIVDVTHQGPIHGQNVHEFEVEFCNEKVLHRETGTSRTSLGGMDASLSIDAAYHGPGILLSSMGGRFPSYFMITHTPVEDGSVKVWHAALVRSPHEPPGPDDIALARTFQAASLSAFAQDFEVWANKRAAIDVMQLPEDGCFARVRRWYGQFYNPRNEAAGIAQRGNGIFGVRGIARPSGPGPRNFSTQASDLPSGP